MDLVAVIVGALAGAGAAVLVVLALLARQRQEAHGAPGATPEAPAPTGPAPGPDAARALAQAVEALRAERRADLASTVDTVLALANERLGTHLDAGARHVEHRNELIAQQLDGMAGELRRVNDAVAGLQRDRAEQHGQLLSGLAETARRSAEVASTAQELRQALSSSKARGQWGERMADDVLRLAGFVEGVSYVRQRAVRGGTIPDFTFLLPGGLQLHMDVKFPLDNYVRHLGATTEAEAAAAGTQFLRDVRERVRSLAGRGYVQPGTTLDFVLLFIPNEAVYGFVHEHDAGLADLALRQKVVLCSPFTLFAVLAVVRQASEASALQRSTDDILQVLGQFRLQWDKFSESLDGLGRKLDTAGRAFDELAGTRRRQLQKFVDRVDDLRQATGDDGAPGGLPDGGVDDEADAGRRPPPHPEPLHLLERRPPGPDEAADVRRLARRLTG